MEKQDVLPSPGTNLHTDVNVGTWLGVIAEMARSRLKRPRLDDTGNAEKAFRTSVVDEIMGIDQAESSADIRRSLLRIAALAIRMADEHYPGDGLEF